MKRKRETTMSRRKERVLLSMGAGGFLLCLLVVMAVESDAWPRAAVAVCCAVGLVLQLAAAAEVCRCTKKGVHKK